MTALPFEDSRRLTGGNLFFAQTGAVLETARIAVDAALLDAWAARVEQARTHLQWDSPLPLVARRHAGGASLAIAAPADQLFTATEVNEWALCASVVARDPSRQAELESALRAAALEQATGPANVTAPAIEAKAALERLAQLAAAERRPDVRELVAAAAASGLAHVVDDRTLTLGTGARGRSWPLEALPAADGVHWSALGDVPTAAVTGSNGKTTTVRLVAACARAQGWRDGYCCTDGVFVAGELVEAGDYSGPAGTRRVLRDPRVEAAVLEMARGGLLRRGLATGHADVAIVTNVSNDHFGEYGIFDLDGLADAKFTVAHLVGTRGLLVLNADDHLLCAKARALPARLGRAPSLGWFALDYDHAELVAQRAAGGPACGVRDGRLVLAWTGAEHDLGPVSQMPITVEGAATYNVANLAGAALVAAALGVAPAAIRATCATFGADPRDNAGRLMRFEVRGARVLLDYAHNPDGLRGVLEVAQRLRASGGRLILVLGHAGNRRDADIAALAQVAASFAPGLVVVKENEGHLRGRAPGEVPEILRRALLSAGLAPRAVELRLGEVDAAEAALERARAGDVVVLPIHATTAREQVLRRLVAAQASRS